MNEQIVDLMRDQFKLIHDKIDMTASSVNAKIDEMKETVNHHVEEDRKYWQAIDDHKAQLKLIKWAFPSGGAVMAWIWSKFGGH